MQDTARLAALAQAAVVSQYTLDTIAALARPLTHRSIGGSQPAYDDTVLPMWHRQMMGQVRRAATAALEYLDVLDHWNVAPYDWSTIRTGRVVHH